MSNRCFPSVCAEWWKSSLRSCRSLTRKFCHERDRSVATLRYLPASAGARTGQHAKLGTITVNEQMNEWAFHDLGHIRQIAELYRTRAFYEKSGPFQRYANPKP